MYNVLRFVLFGEVLIFAATASKTPIQDISHAWANAKISVTPDLGQFSGASRIMRAISHMPAPKIRVRPQTMDPSSSTFGKCDRDYNILCPDKFVNIGPVKKGAEQYCVGGSEYHGPCEGAYAFAGMSPAAKLRWSELCLSRWPCKRCTRDYRKLCPRGWHHEGGAACAPSQDYHGPCKATFDFGSYNEEMREAWSHECGAFWDCDESPGPHNYHDLVGQSVGSMEKPLSFLATRTIPVDGYKIRNSLYLTQPMREPAQASVNVIMHEDLPSMQQESKFQGIEDKTVQLQQQIEDMLHEMTKTAK